MRAHEKARERYVETRDDSIRKPDLSLKISDYHLGLFAQIGKVHVTVITLLIKPHLAGDNSCGIYWPWQGSVTS